MRENLYPKTHKKKIFVENFKSGGPAITKHRYNN